MTKLSSIIINRRAKMNELKILKALRMFKSDIDVQKILSARMLINSFDYSLGLPIQEYEFQVFSQWGDDGIIQYLIRSVDISSKIFIEFGVEDYSESNTRFLLINNNWSGLVMDGSKENIGRIKKDEIYWKYNLKAKESFIAAENVNELIKEYINGNIGLLHIDVDGNDYWLWKAINVVFPDIVIVEYNSILGNKRALTVPYNKDFRRANAHFSNLYAGASLPALCDLADEKGYFLIGSNSAGNNAYFVKKEKIGNLKILSAEEGYVASNFRESRDKSGNLTFVSGHERLALIRDMQFLNIRTNKIEYI